MIPAKISEKQIAVFQGEWPVQKHTLYLLNGLANAGYEVDFFCLESFFIDHPQSYCDPRINIYSFSYLEGSRNDDSNIFKKSVALVENKLQLIKRKFLNLTQNTRIFIPEKINKKVRDIAASKDYLCLIGVEKLGLVWAAQLAEQWQIPYLHYSLELYTSDHPFITSRRYWRRLKKAERSHCQKVAAVIIQDQARAEILFRDNDLSDRPTLYLPVSLSGDLYAQQSSYLRDKFQLSADKVLILQYGQIRRYGKALVEIAQGWPDNYLLVLHDGLTKDLWQCESFVEELKCLDNGNKVVFSLDNLPFDQVQALSASADVGLVFYTDSIKNDQLTGKSSEKLALYLQCGLPIIAFNYPGYGHIASVQAGILIHHLNEVEQAIQTILNAPAVYRHNAQQLFLAEYQFEKNFSAVTDFLANLGDSAPA